MTSILIKLLLLQVHLHRHHPSSLVTGRQLGATPLGRTHHPFYLGPVLRGIPRAESAGTPEKVITGKLFDMLVEELASAKIHLEMTTEKVKTLA